MTKKGTKTKIVFKIKFETKFQGNNLKEIVFQKLSLKFETKFQGNKVTILQN